MIKLEVKRQQQAAKRQQQAALQLAPPPAGAWPPALPSASTRPALHSGQMRWESAVLAVRQETRLGRVRMAAPAGAALGTSAAVLRLPSDGR